MSPARTCTTPRAPLNHRSPAASATIPLMPRRSSRTAGSTLCSWPSVTRARPRSPPIHMPCASSKNAVTLPTSSGSPDHGVENTPWSSTATALRAKPSHSRPLASACITSGEPPVGSPGLSWKCAHCPSLNRYTPGVFKDTQSAPSGVVAMACTPERAATGSPDTFENRSPSRRHTPSGPASHVVPPASRCMAVIPAGSASVWREAMSTRCSGWLRVPTSSASPSAAMANSCAPSGIGTCTRLAWRKRSSPRLLPTHTLPSRSSSNGCT